MTLPSTYKALVAEEEDGQFVQNVKQLRLSELPDNDVLVRVRWSSLNYKDGLSASGNRAVTKNYPFTPGIDAAGEVVQSRDSRFSEGDKVIVTSYDLGMNTPGGFGSYISVPGDWIVPLPKGMSLRDSMCAGTSGLTAAIGVEKIVNAGIYPDDGDLLVTGATGAVGSFGTALLAKLGYRVTAVTGKEEAIPFLKAIGAAEVVSREDVSDVPESPLLKSCWIAALDTVGGSMLDAVIRQAAHNGVVACCGNVLGGELHTSIYPFILRGVSLMGIDSGIAKMEDRAKIWERLSGEWKFSDKKVNTISREVPLDELPLEIAKILKGGQTGKVVISLSD